MRLFALAAAFAALAGNAAAAERPPIVGLAEVSFRVRDLGRARAFYGRLLGYDEAAGGPAGEAVRFRINERQSVEIVPGLVPEQDDRLDHVAFETTDLASLRAWLEEHHLVIEATATHGGGRRLGVRDPDGHGVEFVEHAASASLRAGRAARRGISDRLLHAGLTVKDAAAADRFYKDVLGFSEIWRGGRTDSETTWINMRVPEGTDYLEYMLVSGPVDRERLGSLHHMSLRVADIQAALETLRSRPGGRDPRTVRAPEVGRNRRWHLNLYDPDGTRTELMEPFTMR